jgi:TatD DNase family protein
MLGVIDSHCHLDFPKFEGEVSEIVSRAHENGVKAMVSISVMVDKFDPILEIAINHEHVYCTVGTHPHHADKEPDITADDLIKIAAHEKVVGIGEAGLDYFRNNSPVADQKRSFHEHIDAARQTGLPLVIHNRASDEDMASILISEMAKGKFTPLMHCFSASRELAETTLDLDGYVSFSGILTFGKSEDLRTIAKDIPLDKLLVETDAPYLAPAPHRGKRNEPSFVVHTLEVLAEVKEKTPEEMAKITTDNFLRLFKKVPKEKYLD